MSAGISKASFDYEHINLAYAEIVMNNIKLAIADANPVFTIGIEVIIQNIEDIELIVQAGNGIELIDKIQSQIPDVILMGLRMPIMDGIKATAYIKKEYPDIKIIILTVYDGKYTIANLMKIGANGYLLKNTRPDEIKEAIYTVMEKGNYYVDFVTQAMHEGLIDMRKIRPGFDLAVNLTVRELEVLKLVCRGFTSVQIADKLGLGYKTIEGYRNKLLDKIGVKNTAKLITYALENNLFSLDLRVKNSSKSYRTLE